MKPGATARVETPVFCRQSGRLSIPFALGRLRHRVHALYHDPPELPDAVWQACIDDLVLACLVDVSTAALSPAAEVPFAGIGYRGRQVYRSAAAALRLEVLARHAMPLSQLSFDLRLSRRGRRVAAPWASDPNRVLLLMGGGKDSLYAYHLFRAAGYEVTCFYLTEARRTWQQLRRVHAALEGEVEQCRVYLDANRRGPIEARYGTRYISQFQIGQAIATALPYAIAGRCRYIALGLERSSDAPMFHYCGRPVNHQHQKSSGFIRRLNAYLAWRYSDLVQVVSPLHGLYDLGIYARLLGAAPELVRLQSSCGGSNGRSPHCGQCEKCAFLAALLAGLGGDRALFRRLFPRDPLQDATLYEAWLSPGQQRPLTCAGFQEEVRLALALARQRGWRAEVIEAGDIPACDGRALRSFLRAYPNSLLPGAMRRRLARQLRRDAEAWIGSRA